ncbi:proenkephalin a [Electrophorus electricus]|uniref:proenkephalin a n=1 Tax=Electrophorus electricus TaxID=8005 RepID=UPI0015D0A3C7|nr:proenkephalin a [Electrophorus electricus]
MALTVNSCWIVALSACLALTAGAECGRECALCVYHLLGQQTESGTVTCMLECGGSMDLSRLELCRDALSEDERITIDSPTLEAQDPRHLLTKKYGGFMKRYGGFMMKKGLELRGAESDSLGAVSKKYGGFMKKEEPRAPSEEQQLDLLREVLRVGLGAEAGPQHEGEEAAKRYGGFMRSVRGGSSTEEVGRDLHKRYGGFMRRVGRPQWLDEQKGYGTYKRWKDGGESALPDTQKRYGGFMD